MLTLASSTSLSDPNAQNTSSPTGQAPAQDIEHGANAAQVAPEARPLQGAASGQTRDVDSIETKATWSRAKSAPTSQTRTVPASPRPAARAYLRSLSLNSLWSGPERLEAGRPRLANGVRRVMMSASTTAIAVLVGLQLANSGRRLGVPIVGGGLPQQPNGRNDASALARDLPGNLGAYTDLELLRNPAWAPLVDLHQTWNAQGEHLAGAQAVGYVPSWHPPGQLEVDPTNEKVVLYSMYDPHGDIPATSRYQVEQLRATGRLVYGNIAMDEVPTSNVTALAAQLLDMAANLDRQADRAKDQGLLPKAQRLRHAARHNAAAAQPHIQAAQARIDAATGLFDHVVLRANHGLDYSAHANQLRQFPKLWDADEITFTNDSLFGPLNATLHAAMFARIDASSHGLVGSVRHNRGDAVPEHYQGYFFTLKRAALRNVGVQNYWLTEAISLAKKDDVIRILEVPMTQRLLAAGVTHEGLFDLPACAGNPTIECAQDLYSAGFPYFKKMLWKHPGLEAQLGRVDVATSTRGYPFDLVAHVGQGHLPVAEKAEPVVVTMAPEHDREVEDNPNL